MLTKLTKNDYLKMYRTMLTIRRFEERVSQLYGRGLIGGFCHLYIGQEAVVVGILMTIDEKDSVVTTYRDHGHMIARGLDPKKIMSELIDAESAEAAAKLFSSGKMLSGLGYKHVLVAWGDGKSKIITNLLSENDSASTENDNQDFNVNLVVRHLHFANEFLGKIEALQQRQIYEIQSVQRWMRFGFFLILVHIITAKIKLGL